MAHPRTPKGGVMDNGKRAIGALIVLLVIAAAIFIVLLYAAAFLVSL